MHRKYIAIMEFLKSAHDFKWKEDSMYRWFACVYRQQVKNIRCFFFDKIILVLFFNFSNVDLKFIKSRTRPNPFLFSLSIGQLLPNKDNNYFMWQKICYLNNLFHKTIYKYLIYFHIKWLAYHICVFFICICRRARTKALSQWFPNSVSNNWLLQKPKKWKTNTSISEWIRNNKSVTSSQIGHKLFTLQRAVWFEPHSFHAIKLKFNEFSRESINRLVALLALQFCPKMDDSVIYPKEELSPEINLFTFFLFPVAAA